MAYFDYFCDKCEKEFEIQCSINADRSNVTCPDCGGAEVRRVFSSIYVPKKGGSGGGASAGGGSSCTSCSTHNCGSCH